MKSKRNTLRIFRSLNVCANCICAPARYRGTTDYSNLAVVKSLLPILECESRDFLRWRINEILITTYKMAKDRKDSKNMESTATDYGKHNRVDLQGEPVIPLDKIFVQPFMATDDQRVLEIESNPNISEKISQMTEKYRKETIYIQDVEFEEYDLEFSEYFLRFNPKRIIGAKIH